MTDLWTAPHTEPLLVCMYVIVDFYKLYVSLLVAPMCTTRDMLPCWCVALRCYSPSEQPSQEIKMPLQQSYSPQKTTEQTLNAYIWPPQMPLKIAIYAALLTCVLPAGTECLWATEDRVKHLNPALLFLKHDGLDCRQSGADRRQVTHNKQRYFRWVFSKYSCCVNTLPCFVYAHAYLPHGMQSV